MEDAINQGQVVRRIIAHRSTYRLSFLMTLCFVLLRALYLHHIQSTYNIFGATRNVARKESIWTYRVDSMAPGLSMP